MPTLAELLERNRAWAERTAAEDPAYFETLATGQSPQVLWIGCSDSRVPESRVTGLSLGEVFVHRNLANVVVHTDLNALSVLQYAVDVLEVEHVVVCGHYGCGGVRAALDGGRYGLIDNWLRHIQDVAARHVDELARLPEERRVDRLCELNVAAQVENVCRTTVVEDAWRRGRDLAVHGLVFGLHDGILRDLRVTRTR